MPSKQAPAKVSPSERVETIYKQLSTAANDLNTASDELSKPIQVWEAALKKLNLGVPAWVDLSSSENGTYWWDRGVGYTKIKDRWAIVLRTRSGDYTDSEGDSEEIWPFNDAARWMRIEGVAKLPELLEALLKQAEETTKRIRNRIAQANELADAISKVAEETTPTEAK